MELPIEIITNSQEETLKFAKKFAKLLLPSDFVAFFGGMGVGKTAFVRGIAEEFGAGRLVCSPTFSIVNEYSYDGDKKLLHCDFYRIEDEQELYEIGYFDYLKDAEVLILSEWSEKIEEFLPQTYFKVAIEILGESKRKIIVERKNNI